MRRLALFCGGFAAGIFLAQYLLPGGWLLSGGLVCLALGFGALLLPECWRKRAILCLVGAALALGWNWLYVRQVSEPMEALADSQRALTMTLTEYPTETRFGAKVTVRAEGLPGKLTYYGDPPLLQLSPGQCLTDEVYLQSASRIRDDDVTVFNSKGVFLLAYSRGTVAFHAGTVDAPRWWPARLGRAMQARIRELFSGDDAGFLLALLTGRKGELSTQADVDLSEAGVYHILAVSGMHCAYLLALVGLSHGKAPAASDGGGSHPHADLLRGAHRRVSLGGAGLRDAELSDGGAPVPPGERPAHGFDDGAVPDFAGQPLRGEVRQPATILRGGGGAAVAVS